MSRLSDLADDASRSDVPTAELLRRLKVIAARLGLAEMVSWVDKELTGYSNDDELPDYRGPFNMPIRGDFYGGNRQAKGHPIPSGVFRDEFRDSALFKSRFLEPAAYYDTLVSTPTTEYMTEHWDANFVACFDDLIKPESTLMPGMICHEAWKVVSPALVAAQVDILRSRVLDAALELESIFPEEAGEPGTSDASPQQKEKVATVINNIYGNVSAHNVSIGGTDFSQTVKVNDKADLLAQLRDLGVAEDAVSELSDAIDVDVRQGVEPTATASPSRMKKWLDKHLSQLADEGTKTAVAQLVTVGIGVLTGGGGN